MNGGGFARPPALGAPAPWFAAATDANPRYQFHTVAGRWVMLAFLGSLRAPHAAPYLAALRTHRALFDDARAAYFGLGVDPAEDAALVTDAPGVRHFRDYDRAVSRLYGAAPAEGDGYRPYVLLLDRMLRVAEAADMAGAPALFERLAKRLGPEADPAVADHPPVLVAPRIFEDAFCTRLIDYYRTGAPRPSGFMREQDGRTVHVQDAAFKRRDDVTVEDEGLRNEALMRVRDRLAPLIQRAFGWQATRMERYLISRYGAEEGGHFNAHRDNTTRGTAHRKFAVTINLNAQDYDGGDLRFPEFGDRTWRAPTGGAIVFNCSLLHEATRVTRGERFAFLPFLYDEEGARLRAKNAAFVDPAPQDHNP
jgi:peroxiredoxin